MMHFYDVLADLFTMTKTKAAASERHMNISRTMVEGSASREGHSSHKRKIWGARGESEPPLAPWWGRRPCRTQQRERVERSAGRFNGGRATTFTISSPCSSSPDATLSASETSETGGAYCPSTSPSPSSPCSFPTHYYSPCPTFVSTTGCVRYPCRAPQTMSSGTVTSTTSGTATVTTIHSATTITLTGGIPSSTTTSDVSTITLTSAPTTTKSTSSESGSSSRGSSSEEAPTGSTESEPTSSTVRPPTQTMSDSSTPTVTGSSSETESTTNSSSSPTPTSIITSSTPASTESPSTTTSTSRNTEYTSTTSGTVSATVLAPVPVPTSSSTVRSTTRTPALSTRTRTITRSTLSTSTFTSVVTSTFTDGTFTTTFTSTTVIETGILATDIPDPTGFAMNGPGIIGVSIGSAIGLLLIVLGLFFCLRRLRRRGTPSGSPNNSSTSVVGPGGGWSPPLRDDDEKHMRLISNRMKGLYGAAAAAFSHLNLTSAASARSGREGKDEEKGLSRDVSTRSGAASEESTAVGHAHPNGGHAPAPPSYGYASRIRSSSTEKNGSETQGDHTTRRGLDSTVGSGEGDQVLGGTGPASVRKHNSLYGPRPYPGSVRTTRRYSSTPTSLTQHLQSVQAEQVAHPELAGVSEFGEIPLSEETKQGSQKGSHWYRLSSNGRRPGIPNPFSTTSSSSGSIKGMVEVPSLTPVSPNFNAGPSTSMRPPSSLLSPPRPLSHTPIVIDTNAGSIRSIPPPILTFPRSITSNSYLSTSSSKNPFISAVPPTPPSPAFSQDTFTDDASSVRKEGLLNPGLVSGMGSPSSPRIEQANSIASLRDHMDYSRPLGSGLVNVVERHDSIKTLGSLGSVKEEGMEKREGKEPEGA